MMDSKILNLAIKEARDYLHMKEPPQGVETRALNSLKIATIELLRSETNPDNVLLGTVFTNIKRIPTTMVPLVDTRIIEDDLCMRFNPNWIAFMADLMGNTAIQKIIKHEAIHLLLGHSAALKNYSKGKQQCAAAISMDICINAHLENETTAPFNICPACLVSLLKNDNSEDEMLIKLKKIINALKSGSITGILSCPICHGVGRLEITIDTLNTFLKIINFQTKISLPINFNVAAHRPVYKKIVELPDYLFESNNENSQNKNLLNFFEIGSPNNPLEEENFVFQEAIISTIVHHSIAQANSSKNFSTMGKGTLLESFRKLKVKKSIPYITRVRGTLGASMSDEIISTRYRPNRRFGHIYPGNRAVPKQRYVFAIDTSGSLNQDELKKVISEFVNIKRYSDRIECRILFFHHKVYLDKEITDYKDEDLDKIETGGTNFDEVLETVFENAKRERSQTVLMINTDGYCPISFPRSKIKGKVIWLLTPNSTIDYIKNWDPNAEIIKMNFE